MNLMQVTFPAQFVQWSSGRLEICSDGWEGEAFFFLVSLLPVHTRRYGLDFLVIHHVAPN